VVPASDPLSPGVVEFTGIGQLRLDRPLTDFPGWPSSFDLGPSCGNLTPNDASWDVAQARVTDDGTGVLRVDAVYTYDPRYRTAERMGVGSTISELRTTYGDRLREAKPEFLPDGRPAITEPPYAHYAPLASVFDGENAITFWLGGVDAFEDRVGHAPRRKRFSACRWPCSIAFPPSFTPGASSRTSPTCPIFASRAQIP
jgi:hypothetical protein